MTDLPADVRRTLAARFDEAADAARERRVTDAVDALGRARAALDSADAPADGLRERVDHGCSRAAAVAADEPLVAAEYCRAMREAVAASDGGPGPDR